MSDNEIDDTDAPISRRNFYRHFQEALQIIEARRHALAGNLQEGALGDYDRGLIAGQIQALQFVLDDPVLHISTAALDLPTSDPGVEGLLYREGDGGPLKLSEGPIAPRNPEAANE